MVKGYEFVSFMQADVSSDRALHSCDHRVAFDYRYKERESINQGECRFFRSQITNLIMTFSLKGLRAVASIS